MDEESTLKRILNAPLVMALGALGGFGIILLTFLVVYWIEHRGINTALSLEQGASLARSVPADRVDPAHDTKLVHLTGEATANDALADPDFGIAIKALRLVREVEVYQWIEKKKETKKDKNTTVVYTYTTDWSKDKPQQSFHEPQGHVNPPDLPYANAILNNKDVKVGAFTLAAGQVQKLPASETLPITKELLEKAPDDLQTKLKIDSEGRLFVGSSPDAPRVGDVRIRFKVARQQPVSLVARQTQSTFEPYIPEGGEKIDLIQPGTHAVESMFAAAQSSNQLLTWIVRVLSLPFLALGLGLIVRWRIAGASGNPPDGILSHLLLVIYAGFLSVPLLLIVIGLRWVFQEWMIGGGLLGGGFLILLVTIVLTRTRKSGLFAGIFGGGKTWSKKEREYFRDIALDPENAELRQVFGEHLTKNGDPMGELIRIESEMQGMAEDDEARLELDARAYELLETYGRSWFAPLRSLGLEPPLLGGIYFPSQWMHHGIIDEICLDKPGILPEKADRLFAAVPGLRVIHFTYRPNWAALAKLPLMQQIGEIRTPSMTMDLDDVKAIASSPNFENLAALDIGSCHIYVEDEDKSVYLGPKGAAAIAKSETLTNLRELNFSYSELRAKGTATLAGSANLAKLTSLTLTGNQIGDDGVSALAASPHLKKLQTLILEGNEITAAGAQALAGSPNLVKLTMLDLSRNEIGAAGMNALAQSTVLAKVKTLKLYDTKLDEAALTAMAASPHLGKLEILVLERNELAAAAAVAFAKSTTIRKLKELSFSYNEIGDVGLKALAKWPGLAGVKILRLRENQITADGVKALMASPHLTELKELELSANEIGYGGARALVETSNMPNLKTLWVTETNINDKATDLLKERFVEGLFL